MVWVSACWGLLEELINADGWWQTASTRQQVATEIGSVCQRWGLFVVDAGRCDTWVQRAAEQGCEFTEAELRARLVNPNVRVACWKPVGRLLATNGCVRAYLEG